MQGRKKHILLILLLLLIAFVSMQMMADQNYTEEKKEDYGDLTERLSE